MTIKTLGRQVMHDIFKKISGTSIDENVPRSILTNRAKFRGISRFLGGVSENSRECKELAKGEK